MKNIFAIVLIFVLVQTKVRSQSLFSNTCPNPKPMPDFNVTRFTGKWYETERSLSVFETLWNCPITQVTITGKGIELERGAYASLFNRNYYHRIVRSQLTIPDPRRPGRMETKLPALTQQLKYVVLNTDYTNYALVWSCYERRHLGGALGHFEHIWLMSRVPSLAKDIQQNLYTLLDDEGIRRFYLTKNRMDSCNDKAASN